MAVSLGTRINTFLATATPFLSQITSEVQQANADVSSAMALFGESLKGGGEGDPVKTFFTTITQFVRAFKTISEEILAAKKEAEKAAREEEEKSKRKESGGKIEAESSGVTSSKSGMKENIFGNFHKAQVCS
jgi:hypothetical protein